MKKYLTVGCKYKSKCSGVIVKIRGIQKDQGFDGRYAYLAYFYEDDSVGYIHGLHEEYWERISGITFA